MTTSSGGTAQAVRRTSNTDGAGEPGRKDDRAEYLERLKSALSPQRIGAVYVLLLIIVVFSVWNPGFATWETARSIINENAIIAIVALSLVVPLASGVFDLSIGAVMALTSVMVAWIVVPQQGSISLAIAVGLGAALLVGLVNAVIVVVIGIDSFIATLGTGALIGAVTLLISNDQTITSSRLNTDLGAFVTADIGGITVPVFFALGVALLLWWVLEHTVTGRRLYATGFNSEAARLAGVRTKKIRFIGLVVSAGFAGLAGLLLTARIGAGAPNIAQAYLLDAFAAAFLGATQIRAGRFNAWGTIIAILVLGAGTTGLTMIGASSWLLSFYSGLVLIVSLALTKIKRSQVLRGSQK